MNPGLESPRNGLKLSSPLLVRLALVLLFATTLQLATAPLALADAAGPTDYRTDIVAIEPATDSFAVEMIGGDAFVSLQQLEPVEIIVIGYQSEPYLKFAPDGVVYENRRSPSVWINQERFGDDQEIPAFASAQARPEWSQVADNGRYAWHDHRSHWMEPNPPPGAEAGDQVSEGVVLLEIDGQRVGVTVASFILEKPSVIPSLIGALIGIVGAYLLRRPDRVARGAIGLATAGCGALLGIIAFRSVPSETAPSQLLWLLPVVAAAAAGGLLLLRRHTATTVYLDGLAVTMGGALIAWGVTRFDALWRALIPTNAPQALDRMVIVVALIVGGALALQGVYGLLRPQRLEYARIES